MNDNNVIAKGGNLVLRKRTHLKRLGLSPACVIDRLGYNARYREKVRPARWSLYRSSFNIAVERAVKHARGLGCRLRVLPERCNKREEILPCLRWAEGFVPAPG